MQIFPEMTVTQFGEVEPGSLILINIGGNRPSYALKVIRNVADGDPQLFVLPFDPRNWGRDNEPCLIAMDDEQETLNLGKSYLVNAAIEPENILLEPNRFHTSRLGLIVAGEEKFFSTRAAGRDGLHGINLWTNISSGEVVSRIPAVEAPQILIPRWELIPIVPEALRATIQPEPFFKWPLEGSAEGPRPEPG